MSIKEAILGILTMGPTYGHQILTEIQTRLPHRARVNPGQVYSSLSRMVASGHITPAGKTLDNLPTYQLTPQGTEVASLWLSGLTPVDLLDWNEVMDVVLLASSLPKTDIRALTMALSRQELAGSRLAESAAEELSNQAQRIHLAAVRDWLTSVESAIARGDLSVRSSPAVRPSRGRRPSNAVAPRSD